MTGRIRIGVVGAGWWATQFHIPSILTNPNVELTALADVDAQRLDRAARHFGTKALFTDAANLFESGSVDAVVIATPHATHYPLVKAALEHNLDVLCEKPFVLQSQQGRELLQMARMRSLHLVVGYTYQFTAHARNAKKIIQSGGIGELVFVSGLFASMVEAYYRGETDEYDAVFHYPVNAPGRQTYSDPALSGGGQAQTQICHAINMIFSVTGRRCVEVQAFMNNRDLKVDLVDAIAYRLDNGALGTMGSTGTLRGGQSQQQEIRYYGTDGYLLQELIHGKLSFCRNDGTLDSLPDLGPNEVYPAREVSGRWIDLILHGGENWSDAETAVRTVEFIEAAYRSASSNLPVTIDSIRDLTHVSFGS
jgi:predicted dehydrogenase